jgi:outer membrane immunogenic protein
MKKLLFAGIAAPAIAAAGPAAAADLPSIYKAPVVAPLAVNSWTGCYFGGNAGGVWANSDVIWTPNAAAIPNPVSAITTQVPTSLDSSGFTGGGQIGCNYQAGWAVFGLEADLQYTGLSATNSGALAVGGIANPFTQSFDSKWLSTTRGRLGITNGPWLVYATGGLAVANVSYSDSILFPGSGSANAASLSDTRTGWTVGGGVEWAFAPNWSVKAEYLHVDLGTISYTSNNGNVVVFPFSTIVHDHRLTEDIARVGVNYRFGWGGPVVANH